MTAALENIDYEDGMVVADHGHDATFRVDPQVASSAPREIDYATLVELASAGFCYEDVA